MGGISDNNYENDFQIFYEYVAKTNKEVSEKTHEGYLVDFKDCSNLLSNKQQNQENQENQEAKNGDISTCDSERSNKKKITPKYPKGLKNQLINDKRFILINKDFYGKICKKSVDQNPYKISYKISKDYLVLYPNQDEVLKFKKSENNLIDKSTLFEQNEIKINITNNIDKIYNDIITYYNMEKNIEKELKNPTNNGQKFECFLVDKDWVDKWKKYSYYDSIKREYLEKNILDKDKIINMIKAEQAKNYLKYDEVNDLENYLALNEKKVYDSIKVWNKSYAILKKDFINLFTITKDKNLFKPIPLQLLNNLILIQPPYEVKLYCKIDNNIISKNNDASQTLISMGLANNNNANNLIKPNQNLLINQMNNQNNNINTSEYLKHLIRTIYFKKEFLNPNNQFKNNITQVFLIRKNIISDLKEKFKLSEIIPKIENHEKLNDITYNNFERYFPLILEAIKERDNYYLDSIKIYDTHGTINYALNQTLLVKKSITNNKQIPLNYVDNFEIIDPGFAFFLDKYFNKNIQLTFANFLISENFILLMINHENKYIYEIACFRENCELTIEYLIDPISFEYSNIDNFNNHIFLFFMKNGIKKLILSDNPIKTENDNIIFIIYPLFKNNLKNSINNTNNVVPEANNFQNNEKNNNIQDVNLNKSLIINNNMNNLNNPLTLVQTKGQTHQLFNNILPNINPNLPQPNSKLLYSQAPQFSIPNETQYIPQKINEMNPLNKSQIVANSNNLVNKGIKPNNNEVILDNNLKIGINLTKEKESLIQVINQSNTNQKILYKECFLINKGYTNILEESFHLNKIYEIMSKNPGKNDNDMLNILKENLSDNIKMELSGLNKNIFQNDLNDKNFNKVYVKKNFNKKVYFYKHCNIISNEFLNQLNKIDNNIRNHCKKVLCVFDKNKIIFLLNNEIINIANYKNNEIIVEYIINSPNSYNLFEEIKKGGYNFISQYIPYDTINNPNNSIYMSIYKITTDGNEETRISDKLKSLMYLSFSQYNYNYNTPQRVYLINPKWLKQFNYGKINELVNEIVMIPNFKLDLTDLNSMSAIIPYLDIKKLKNMDNSFIYGCNPSIQFDCSAEVIIILNEYLLIFKNFILTNQQSYEYLKNNFGIQSNSLDISYIHKPKEGDILIIKNYPLYLQQAPNRVENLMIFGNLDRTKNNFSIKYELKFFDANILEKEIGEITKYSIKDYINQRVLLSEKIKNDYISPIFVNNQRVGTFYLYKKDFDYRKCFYYDQYLHNRQLMKSLYLFANKINLNIRLVNKTPFDEEFYLIRKNIILDIKKGNNYEQYKQYFMKKIQIFNGKYIGDREKYILIKTMSKNDLYNLSKMNNKSQNNSHQGNIQINQTINEIDINAIPNPLNPNESFMIGKDFEIVEKICAHFLFKDINPNTYTKILCTFVGNDMIIFHYPINAFNYSKYDICAISRYDRNKNDFINEYLIKYNTSTSYKMHINQIKSDLNSFLSNLKFDNNNIAKIINPGLNDIGIIIKIISNPVDSDIITKINPGEKIFAVSFVSMGSQDISNYALVCKNTDLFLILEERLYQDYPQIRNKKVLFMCNAKEIDRYKTLEQNNIKSKDIINVFVF